MQKSISVVAVAAYDSEGKRIDSRNQHTRPDAAKYSAIPLRVSVNQNLTTEFSPYHSVTFCQSYKKAEELASLWNKAYKENGTFME